VKILFVSWPGYGHLLPMLPMVRAAQSAGIDVMVSTGRDLLGVAEQWGVEVTPSGVTAAEGYASLPDVGPIDALAPEEQTSFAARYLFGPGALARARDLTGVVDTWRPDLVVHDSFELGSAVVARAHGIRHVTHGYGPPMPQNDGMIEAVASFVREAGHDDPRAAVLGAPYLDIAPPGLHPAELMPWADVRPLRPSAGESVPDAELVATMAALPHEHTVYLTLGTVMNQAPHVFRAVLDACAALRVNVVVTTGHDLDPAAVTADREGVLAREYLPQAAVLPHVHAVVSHAGAGTLLGALCHGLPQLGLPLGTDQPLNAAVLAATGSALVLSPPEVTADTVADAVRRLLTERSYAEAAARLRDEIEAMPPAGDVLATLL
jgi:UDP:flavonoid glycosyltransferase YjiC (YdhE family)